MQIFSIFIVQKIEKCIVHCVDIDKINDVENEDDKSACKAYEAYKYFKISLALPLCIVLVVILFPNELTTYL